MVVYCAAWGVMAPPLESSRFYRHHNPLRGTLSSVLLDRLLLEFYCFQVDATSAFEPNLQFAGPFDVVDRPTQLICISAISDVTVADEDAKSKLTDNAKRAIQGNVLAKLATYASGAIWWSDLGQVTESISGFVVPLVIFLSSAS